MLNDTMQIGKTIGRRLYLHSDAIRFAEPGIQELILRAQTFGHLITDQFNVVRVNVYAGQVSFLLYPRFFDDPFPELNTAVAVDLRRSIQSKRMYSESLNPPILHRKELLLPAEHPARPLFQTLTDSLVLLGAFRTDEPIGFRRQWNDQLANLGYMVEGHSLVPIANEVAGCLSDNARRSAICIKSVPRHLTALSRDRLSAPLRFLERFGFLNGSLSVFDYGCGKGDDLRYLQTTNVPSFGWDPHYRPDDPLVTSDIVNLGFVINVIEDLAERQYAISRAFSLARMALIVSAMLEANQRKDGQPFRDGFISTRGTFQKYYAQHELQTFIDAVLDESPIPLGPGIFIVFTLVLPFVRVFPSAGSSLYLNLPHEPFYDCLCWEHSHKWG